MNSNTQIVSMDDQITLKQAEESILANRSIKHYLKGSPGIGKTSIAQALEKATGYRAFIIPCADIELGDIAMPVIDHENKLTRFYPSERFGLHLGKPIILILDEFTKASQSVQNMLHPALEQFRPRVAGAQLPEGSIVVLTGNLVSDGVGDNIKAHTRSRVVPIHVRNPTAEQWVAWMVQNGGHPTMLAWAMKYTHAFASYLDEGQESNELIFNPKAPTKGYFCPRAGKTASDILWNKDKVDYETLSACIEGAVGAPSKESILQFDRFHTQMPPWADIINNPMGTPLPTDPGALAVLTFSSIEKLQHHDELDSLLKYLERTGEWDAIFSISLARHKTKSLIAFKNTAFAKWVAENEDLL